MCSTDSFDHENNEIITVGVKIFLSRGSRFTIFFVHTTPVDSPNCSTERKFGQVDRSVVCTTSAECNSFEPFFLTFCNISNCFYMKRQNTASV